MRDLEASMRMEGEAILPDRGYFVNLASEKCIILVLFTEDWWFYFDCILLHSLEFLMCLQNLSFIVLIPYRNLPNQNRCSFVRVVPTAIKTDEVVSRFLDTELAIQCNPLTTLHFPTVFQGIQHLIPFANDYKAWFTLSYA